MKNIKILTLILASLMLNISCDTDGGTSVIPLDNGALSNFTLAESSAELIINTTFASLDLEFKVDVIVGDPQSTSLKAMIKTFAGPIYGPITIEANIPSLPKDYVISGSEIISAFPELNSATDLEAGDILIFYTSFTMKNGKVLDVLNGDGAPNYYAADFNQYPVNINNTSVAGSNTYFLAYPVSCAPQPGTYTIDMHDSFGDGWQTTADSGGVGMKLILDGIVVAEFGMCSPYGPSVYPCSGVPATSGFNDASTTVTIPVGTESAVWQFPGDSYAEIGFEIYGPNNELLLESGFGEAAAGPLTVVLCAD